MISYRRCEGSTRRYSCNLSTFDSCTSFVSSRPLTKFQQDEDGKWHGVDIEKGGIVDTFTAGIWEPSDNKSNSLASAAEAAGVILSIDETVINPRSQDPGAATGMMGGAPAGGMGQKSLSNMMGGGTVYS